MNQNTINKTTLVMLVIGISVLFFSMISHFLMTIFLAGLFSALAHPVFRRFEIVYKGRRHLASLTTLILMVTVVLIPLMILAAIMVTQAIDVGQSVAP